MDAIKEKACTLCGADGHTATNCKWLDGQANEACPPDRLAAFAERLRAALARLEPRSLYIIMVEELRLAAAVARRAGFALCLVALDDKWAQLLLSQPESEQIGRMVKFIT